MVNEPYRRRTLTANGNGASIRSPATSTLQSPNPFFENRAPLERYFAPLGQHNGLVPRPGNLNQRADAGIQKTAGGPTGLTDGFVKACQRWDLSEEEQTALLGYEPNNAQALAILKGLVDIPTHDIRDRMAYVVSMSLFLRALFNRNRDSEVAWLHAGRTRFDGKSAIDLLLEGRMAGLLKVRQLISDEVTA